MKRLIALCLALVMVLSLAACGTKNDPGTDGKDNASDAENGGEKTYSLKVAGIDGSSTLFPVFVAQEKGWFEEAGLNIDRIGFTNGPVTMEAIDTWDISVTGVGGVQMCIRDRLTGRKPWQSAAPLCALRWRGKAA